MTSKIITTQINSCTTNKNNYAAVAVKAEKTYEQCMQEQQAAQQSNNKQQTNKKNISANR